MATSKKAPVADTSATPETVPPKSVTKPKAAAKKVEPAVGVPAVPVAKKAVVKAMINVSAKVAPKAPAAAKPAAPFAAPKAMPKLKAAAKKAGKVEGPAIDQAQRANYIEVAAYYIAQRRGFMPGDPEQDYLNAAAEVDQMIAAGHFSK